MIYLYSLNSKLWYPTNKNELTVIFLSRNFIFSLTVFITKTKQPLPDQKKLFLVLPVQIILSSHFFLIVLYQKIVNNCTHSQSKQIDVCIKNDHNKNEDRYRFLHWYEWIIRFILSR